MPTNPNPSPEARRERPQPVEIVGNHWIHRDHSDSDAQFYRREEIDRLLDSLESKLRAISEVLKEKPEHPHEAGYIFGYYSDHKVNSREARIRSIVEGK